MSSSDEGNRSYSQAGFVELLQEHSVLFLRSQMPSVKAKKTQALQELVKKYQSKFGRDVEESKLMKKIFNMRNRVKKKTCPKRTGNKKISLKNWEKELLKLMQADSYHSVSCIKDVSARIGVNKTGDNTQQQSSGVRDESLVSVPSPSSHHGIVPLIMPVSKDPLASFETEVTCNMTNSELERLVLLKQLKVLELKEKLLSWEVSQRECDIQYLHVNHVETRLDV